MPKKGSIGDARERSREVGRNDGLGADPTRTAAAARRDEAAAERDSEANARDGLAAMADSEQGASSRFADPERQDQRSARDREAAASDRVEAGLDRAQAATDRELATDGIANEVCDHLTGAMGPRFGLAALRREILRTERSDELLLVAFVEAVGQEVAGQRSSQGDNDRILQDIAECLSDDLRDYDLIARVADAGFVCAQAGQSIDRAVVRFRDIAQRLSRRQDRPQMKVGLVAREAGDTFEALVERADGSLIETAG